MRNRRELLCCLGIAATLLLLGASAWRTAAEKQAFCAGNLQKLYRLTLAYEADHGELPPVIMPQKPRWKFWSNCLRPYTDDKRAFACPADPRQEYLFEDENPLFQPTAQSAISYGMNYFLTSGEAQRAVGKPAKLENLSRPGATVFLADSKGPYLLPPRFWEHERDFRHDKAANFLFADGRVRLLKQQDFGRTGPDGKFETEMRFWRWN